MKQDIESIANQFQIDGVFLNAQFWGTGHVHDTYVVAHDQDGARVRSILQRINHDIFKDPPAMMENITRVTHHIREKLIAEGADDISRRVLTVISTRTGGSYYKDDNGNYWRVYVFIEGGKTFDTLQSPEQAYEVARMFGQFQRMLVDLPEPPLHETIADFHNGPKRFRDFQRALDADVCNRAKNAKEEIAFILKHAGIFDALPALVDKGKIPVRVTHNDTKINNVILDEKTGQGLCIIDLDTVMSGLALYDFGDMVRTATNPAEEDELDLSKVTMQMGVFEKLACGFLEETNEFLTIAEKQHLAFAGKLITFEQATRFLTDYLAGDTYYKVSRQHHNLDRCRTQLKLVQSIIQQEDEMNTLVHSFS